MNKDLKIPQIKTVIGRCPECKQTALLFSIVSDFYRCTNCGADTRQHINGSIRYLKLSESDKAYIKEHDNKDRY